MKFVLMLILAGFGFQAYGKTIYSCSGTSSYGDVQFTFALEGNRIVQVVDEFGEWSDSNSTPYPATDGTFSSYFVLPLNGYGDIASLTIYFLNEAVVRAEGYAQDDDRMFSEPVQNLTCVR